MSPVILEIMAAPEIQEIMHHLHEIMLIGIMVIQALVTIMDQEVIGMFYWLLSMWWFSKLV